MASLETFLRKRYSCQSIVMTWHIFNYITLHYKNWSTFLRIHYLSVLWHPLKLFSEKGIHVNLFLWLDTFSIFFCNKEDIGKNHDIIKTEALFSEFIIYLSVLWHHLKLFSEKGIHVNLFLWLDTFSIILHYIIKTFFWEKF